MDSNKDQPDYRVGDNAATFSGRRQAMSDPYTPTTIEVCAIWSEWNGYGGLTYRTTPEPSRHEMRQEFFRWLAKVQAEAWDEGNRYGIDKHCEAGCYEDRERNPYRNGENRHADQ